MIAIVRSRTSIVLNAVIMLVVVVAQCCEEAQAISLEQALANGYENNPQLQAERAALRAKDELYNQAVGHFRPTLQFNGSQNETKDFVSGGTPAENEFYSGQNPTSSYSISLAQPLFNSGQTDAEKNQALANIRAERYQLINIEQTVLAKIAVDYCDVVRDNATYELALHDEQFLGKKVDYSRAKYAGGEFSRVDVAQAEAAYQHARAARFTAESNAEKSRREFVRDAGVEPGTVQYPPPMRFHFEDGGSAAEVASLQNPSVISAEYIVDAARASVKKDMASALPNIGLTLSAQHIEGALFKNGQENVLSAGIKLTVPIYSGGEFESQTRADEQLIAVYQQRLADARASVSATAATTWSARKAAESNIDFLSVEVKADETALEGVQKQQLSGERILLDVLNAEQALQQARLDLNSAYHDRVVAEYSLASALGLATARQLRLNVKYYDPEAHFFDISNKWFGFGIDK